MAQTRTPPVAHTLAPGAQARMSLVSCGVVPHRSVCAAVRRSHAMQCNAMQCNAMQCNAMQCTHTEFGAGRKGCVDSKSGVDDTDGTVASTERRAVRTASRICRYF